jgi:hypothetical protein
MQVANDKVQPSAIDDQWTTWGQPPAGGAGGRKAAVLIPVAVLVVLGLAAVAFVLTVGPAGAAAACGGG